MVALRLKVFRERHGLLFGSLGYFCLISKRIRKLRSSDFDVVSLLLLLAMGRSTVGKPLNSLSLFIFVRRVPS